MKTNTASNNLAAQFSTALLMRIGSKEKIEHCYQEKKLAFGCAANWADYAKSGNYVTGDQLECIFAHVRNDDPRLSDLRDSHGLPMGNHVEILKRIDDQTSFLRYTPTLMVPALCFFSFNEKMIAREVDGIVPIFPKTIIFDLEKYRTNMKYRKDDAAFLLITNPVFFFEELHLQIRKAIQDNSDKLTTERYYDSGQPVDVFCNEVNYQKYKVGELFFDDAHAPSEELFWKAGRYSWQHEVRVIVANINFKNLYGVGKHDYKSCSFEVKLPHFQEYSEIYLAKDVSSIQFYKVRKEGEILYSIC